MLSDMYQGQTFASLLPSKATPRHIHNRNMYKNDKAALSMRAKAWKPPTGPSTVECMDKWWHRLIRTNSMHNMDISHDRRWAKSRQTHQRTRCVYTQHVYTRYTQFRSRQNDSVMLEDRTFALQNEW